jgi:hypothetical protein
MFSVVDDHVIPLLMERLATWMKSVGCEEMVFPISIHTAWTELEYPLRWAKYDSEDWVTHAMAALIQFVNKLFRELWGASVAVSSDTVAQQWSQRGDRNASFSCYLQRYSAVAMEYKTTLVLAKHIATLLQSTVFTGGEQKGAAAIAKKVSTLSVFVLHL